MRLLKTLQVQLIVIIIVLVIVVAVIDLHIMDLCGHTRIIQAL